MDPNKRKALCIALGLALAAVQAAQADEAPKAVRIGWVAAKTGSDAPGAATTTVPNYKLWVKEVNAQGGLLLKAYGKRVPIEVVEYDDRSSSEEAVRATERLITQDQVDFILPPWGTAINLAVGPTLAKHGYPHLAVTSITERAPELAKRWPNASFFLGMGSQYGEALVGFLDQARKAGKIGERIAMVSVADGFGVDLSQAARKAIEKHGFKLVYDKSYPVGTQDMTPLLNEIKGLNPDVFVAFSYPPDTIMITDQSRVVGFNPKVFYAGVGTQFPIYKKKFGASVDGVMGPGGVDFDSPVIQDYFKRHTAALGQEPDRWASSVTWASLQVLQQAIERVGKLDRAAVAQEIKSGSFDTVLGPLKLENQLFKNLWWVGQWQNGEFYGVAPSDKKGAKAAVIPKPAWNH
jgi:branched-chain amino acid transport system substrate-binding protein